MTDMAASTCAKAISACVTTPNSNYARSELREMNASGSAADWRLAGTHRLTFATGAWFQAQGVAGFYPEVTVVFQVEDPEAHHHVPLLLSPFGYSTYRGS